MAGSLASGSKVGSRVGSTIAAAGPYREVLRHASGLNGVERIELEDSALIPALINAHCHLELSGAGDLRDRLVFGRGFTPWVRSLMGLREQILEKDRAKRHIRAQAGLLYGSGTCAVADHENSSLVKEATEGLRQPGHAGARIIPLKEIIHPEAGLPEMALMPGHSGGLAAHSPFLCSPDVIKWLKGLSRGLLAPFSIHVAESEDELLFLKERRGPLGELLDERGRLPLPYHLPRLTPVRLLQDLGVLDDRTICVHCVHVEEDEMDILAGTRANVCLCPESNRIMGVGTAPAEELMKRGINVCLGTDSLASNTRLDLFGEMACLAASNPGLRPEAILRAATEAGARALGLWPKMGRIGPGASTPILALGPIPKRLDEVCEFLVKEACRQPGFIRRMIGVG